MRGSDAVIKDLKFPDVDSLRGTSWQNTSDRATLPRNTVLQLRRAGLSLQ